MWLRGCGYGVIVFVLLRNRRPPRSTRTDTRVPDTTRFRSAVIIRLRPTLRGAVLRAVRGRHLGFDIDDEADLVGAAGAIGLHRPPVRAHQVAADDRRFEHVAMPRREHTVQIDRKSTRLNSSH